MAGAAARSYDPSPPDRFVSGADPSGDPPRPATLDLFLVGAHGPARTVGYAEAAERAGFAGVWLAEHHFIRYGRNPSATTLAAHILARTSRLAVGTAACVLSTRHPVALGEEALMLDALAPGRFRLGVARGGPWVDLEVFGAGLTRYRHGFAEALDLLRRWLSGARRVGADGQWFAFREVTVVPRPSRRLPVWVAATSPATVDLAAARGLPLLLGVHEPDGAKAALLHRYGRVAADHGHDPARVPHASVHLAWLGDPERLRPRLSSWLATTRDYVRLDGPAAPRDPDRYADRLLRIHPVGDPADVAAGLKRAGAVTGARHLLLMVEAAGGDTGEQITALGAHLCDAPGAVPPAAR